ncbi:hypothetical protein [Pseudonocardia sp. TRM90224]|uniref:hypothetical protein n=1 Tax=Pseudonocardia sp. TRM90224 TaxID=2812678 RepID=UPI001E44A691|nr:hypothetical protein [Pseudonocardia sp. TRM90224]
MLTTDPPVVTRRPCVTLWLMRTAATLHLVVVLCQPVLAGMFLTGDVDAIAVHGTIGSLLAAYDLLVLLPIAIAYVTGGRGRVFVLPVVVVLFLATGFQIGMGYSRELQLHVPLGVLIVTAAVLLAAWSWTASAARGRGAARSPR